MTYEPTIKVERVTVDLHEIMHAYDLLMSTDSTKQMHGLKKLYYHMKAMRDNLDKAVREYDEPTHLVDPQTYPSAAEMAAENHALAEQIVEPPVPPVKPMPRRETQKPFDKGTHIATISGVYIYDKVINLIFNAAIRRGPSFSAMWLREFLGDVFSLGPTSRKKTATCYLTYLYRTQAINRVTRAYTGQESTYRFVDKSETTPAPAPQPEPAPATPKKTRFTEEKRGKVIERFPHNRVIYEGVLDHLLRSFIRGAHFTTLEVEHALVKFGYRVNSADKLAPMYIDWMIRAGKWQATPTVGILLAKIGIAPPLDIPDETPEQKAKRAEDERRAHTDTMGGAH
jgi:hypothetical protein